MRLLLYIAAFVVYSLALIPALFNESQQGKLLDLAILAFVAIAADVAYRLRKSVYIFYPVVWGAALLYLYLKLPQYNYAPVADYLVHIPLGIMLILKSRTQSAEDAGVKNILLWLGVLSLAFSLRVLTLFIDTEALHTFFRVHLESYIIIAIAGKALLENRFEPLFKPEREVAVLLVVLNALLVVKWLTGLIFENAAV